jgi:hypothetical protein
VWKPSESLLDALDGYREAPHDLDVDAGIVHDTPDVLHDLGDAVARQERAPSPQEQARRKGTGATAKR